MKLNLGQSFPGQLSKFCFSIVTANNHNHVINSSFIYAMSCGEDLQIWNQDPTAEAVGVQLLSVVKEHHPGIVGGAAIDDGGGGWDDATPGVGEALCLTLTQCSINKGESK